MRKYILWSFNKATDWLAYYNKIKLYNNIYKH